LPNYFPTGLFHRAGLSIKDLPTYQPGARPKYKLEDLLVDAIFSSMLRLPNSFERQVYYASLLTEVTKLAPQNIAPTLGRAIRWIYEHLDDLSGDLNMRFSTWFAIHLSNFGFTYKWDEWYHATRNYDIDL
jgi:nuclear cap-binding protein subunit 1